MILPLKLRSLFYGVRRDELDVEERASACSFNRHFSLTGFRQRFRPVLLSAALPRECCAFVVLSLHVCVGLLSKIRAGNFSPDFEDEQFIEGLEGFATNDKSTGDLDDTFLLRSNQRSR